MLLHDVPASGVVATKRSIGRKQGAAAGRPLLAPGRVRPPPHCQMSIKRAKGGRSQMKSIDPRSYARGRFASSGLAPRAVPERDAPAGRKVQACSSPRERPDAHEAPSGPESAARASWASLNPSFQLAHVLEPALHYESERRLTHRPKARRQKPEGSDTSVFGLSFCCGGPLVSGRSRGADNRLSPVLRHKILEC